MDAWFPPDNKTPRVHKLDSSQVLIGQFSLFRWVLRGLGHSLTKLGGGTSAFKKSVLQPSVLTLSFDASDAATTQC